MTVLVGYLVLFLAVAVVFILAALLIGKLIRPAKPSAEKLMIYECGEPTIGTSWVQFDLRFYVVALLFVIFDVEVAFFFPWAVVFGHANTIANSVNEPQQAQVAKQELVGMGDNTAVSQADRDAAHQLAWLAFWDILVFFGVLLVGFAYLWKRGDLAWVRSTAAEKTAGSPTEPVSAVASEGVLVG